MILWHNTKLKTIGAIMSTLCIPGCCRCCSVCSIECCVFSVYISYIPQYLHIYRFTHCRLTLSSPVRLWAECSRENKQLPVCGLCAPALCHSYFGQISQNPSRLKMLHTAPHTRQRARQNYHVSHHSKSPADASVSISVFSSCVNGSFFQRRLFSCAQKQAFQNIHTIALKLLATLDTSLMFSKIQEINPSCTYLPASVPHT